MFGGRNGKEKMLKLIPYDQEKTCRTLDHGPEVFHHALRAVLNGETLFHVKNPNGENYDLEYHENNAMVPKNPLTEGRVLFPPYFFYDEKRPDRMYLKMFDEYSAVLFEETNEYTVVLTKAVLQYTEKEVYITDDRILWFVQPDPRLHIVDTLPEYHQINAIYSGKQLATGYNTVETAHVSPTPLFHNVFLWQWLTDLEFKDVKYVEMTMGYLSGIGAILAQFTRVSNAFAQLGWKTVLKRETSRYKDEMLERYFNLEMSTPDANETNTVYIANCIPLVTSKFVASSSADFDTSVLTESFIKELNEYKEIVLGRKHMLGVLIRGTDYITTKMHGSRKMATVDEMKPLIHEWMEQDHYDGIFLATEDQDILDQMKQEFPGKIRAIAQERHRVSDFKTSVTLAGIEKEESAEIDYDEILEDNTVNYFYALYMLSQCDSFMCSGQCNGWDVVRSFNGGQFQRCHKFQVQSDFTMRPSDAGKAE